MKQPQPNRFFLSFGGSEFTHCQPTSRLGSSALLKVHKLNPTFANEDEETMYPKGAET